MEIAAERRDVKACVRCQHYRKPFFSSVEYAECWAPETLRVHMITGEQKPRFCSISRDADWHCGQSAKYFREKK
jgi:hypothetical protein